VILLGINLSLIALLELSSHILPAAQVSGPLADIESLLQKKSVLGDSLDEALQLRPRQGLDLNDPSDASKTRYLDIGNPSILPYLPTPTPTPTDTDSDDISDDVDEDFYLPTDVPTQEEVENHGGNSTSSDGTSPLETRYYMTEPQYFVASVLPTFLAVILLIPYKVIYLQATSLHPFRAMTASHGTTGYRSILTSHLGIRSIIAPVFHLLTGHTVVFIASSL
jgi:hypothetical protein